MDTFISNSPEETFALGQRWAAEGRPGWVIGLIGDLGTGKTQLVKGLAAGLGIADTVTSPTFALLQEHDDGALPLVHIDLYRLESQSEIISAGLEHYLTAPVGLAAVEWFERWLGGEWQPGQPLPESSQPAAGQALRLVHLADEGETKRRIVHEDFGD
ncbi:MAG: tRNA (adenosine(37)-N6)-threonylcarbamoyltransferase complex ATPase subunit type 1 TsaE [Verrucomicrobiota bacterium]|nr:tRNA (adenosine(37)-N6)-threonylcarbamoyltransferase complex ATPase subunit type 1 TsaE [Verrucomicrobiota bacterium]MDP7048762.1 tRNA (adenosine(37)-N6)-threonylcarbamoyltransferase complex ATPase subunit type 1 TsaE [Verrucomicrobiota bacterium]